MSWYYKTNSSLEDVRAVGAEEQVVDTVLAKAKVTDVTVAYEEASEASSSRPQAEVSKPAPSDFTCADTQVLAGL